MAGGAIGGGMLAGGTGGGGGMPGGGPAAAWPMSAHKTFIPRGEMESAYRTGNLMHSSTCCAAHMFSHGEWCSQFRGHSMSKSKRTPAVGTCEFL